MMALYGEARRPGGKDKEIMITAYIPVENAKVG